MALPLNYINSRSHALDEVDRCLWDFFLQDARVAQDIFNLALMGMLETIELRWRTFMVIQEADITAMVDC